MPVTSPTAPTLVPGRAYTWDQLGRMFNFKPRYLSVAGGMLPRPALNALILVTWPGGARSFDYDDYWSQGDLIYTGRGKTGHQKLEGANRDLDLTIGRTTSSRAARGPEHSASWVLR